MNIPEDLVKSLIRHDTVLFVGAGLSISAGLPDWHEMVGPLADHIDLPQDQRDDPLKVAQYYENRRGRNALIRYILERTDTAAKRPTPNHLRLLGLGCRTWVTTNYDDLLEQTLRVGRMRFTRVVREQDLPYSTSEANTVVKMHGDRDQPDTIVITRNDYHTYFRRFPRIVDTLSGLLTEKTFLFVGYGINDPDFNQIRAQIAFDLGRHQRMAYAVAFDADEFAVEDCRCRNIHVLNIVSEQGNYTVALGNLLDDLIARIELPTPEMSLSSTG